MIEFSVVIPTYNRKHKIADSIKSVLQQKEEGVAFRIKEVLVIDDASTDGTESLIRSMPDKRIVYHRLDENRGAGNARNAGVKLAMSQWIAFQDSDDIWHEDKLIRQLRFQESNPQYKVIACGYTAFAESGNRYTVLRDESKDIFEEIIRRNFAGAPAIIVEKEYYESIGGFEASLRALEDWDFALRVAASGLLGMVNETLLDVYLGSDGVSSDAGNYYEARCRMIAMNKNILMQRGCFEQMVETLLLEAQNKGILDMIGKMLEMYLRG